MVSGFVFWDLSCQFHSENVCAFSLYRCSSEEMKCDLYGPCGIGVPGGPGGQGQAFTFHGRNHQIIQKS